METTIVSTQANEKPAEQIVQEKVSASLSQSVTPPEEGTTTEPTKNDDDYSHRFAELAKRDQFLSDREKKVKAYEETLKKYERLEKLRAEDPSAFFEESGLDFNNIARSFIEKAAGKREPTADEKIALLEKKIQEKEKAEEDERQQAAIGSFKKQLFGFIEEERETYELINSMGEQELVYSVIEEYYQKNGSLLDHKKAADLVEAELTATLEKVKATKKAKNLFAPSEEVQQNVTSGLDQAKSGKDVVTPINSKTLTAKAVPVTTEAPKTEGKLLSREESLKRAAEFLKKKLEESKAQVRV